MRKMNKIYADGSGWNGIECKYCVYIKGSTPLIYKYKTKRSNNEMEYLALITALEIANKEDIIFSDSQLVVNQVSLKWKCNYEHLRLLRDTCIRILKDKNVRIIWIPRNGNLAGKILEGKI